MNYSKPAFPFRQTCIGIDAMREVTDRPRVLTLRSQLDDKGNIVVSVADSGVGLDPTNHERIFETFFKTKATGKWDWRSAGRSLKLITVDSGRKPGIRPAPRSPSHFPWSHLGLLISCMN